MASPLPSSRIEGEAIILNLLNTFNHSFTCLKLITLRGTWVSQYVHRMLDLDLGLDLEVVRTACRGSC